MARISDEAQWIILIAFIVSISIFILALIVNSSVLVGQTTSEAVLEFPKHEIQDLRGMIIKLDTIDELFNESGGQNIPSDFYNFSLERDSSVTVITRDSGNIIIHFNNGITEYQEVYNESLKY